MQRFPIAIHDDWTELLGTPLGTKDAIREGAGLAIAGLDQHLASVEAAGFAVKDDQLLVRVRFQMADIPGVIVWEQTIDPAALEAAGVDFAGPSAPHEVGGALHALLLDFVKDQRTNSLKRHL